MLKQDYQICEVRFGRKIALPGSDFVSLRCYFSTQIEGPTNETETNEQTTSSEGDAVNLSGATVHGAVTIESANAEEAEYAIQQANETAQATVESVGAENLATVSTLNNIAGDFAQITANAAPQSEAAQQEILAGSEPIAAEGTGTVGETTPASTTLYNAVWILVGIGTLIYLIEKKKTP
jgi:hypothetical protein